MYSTLDGYSNDATHKKEHRFDVFRHIWFYPVLYSYKSWYRVDEIAEEVTESNCSWERHNKQNAEKLIEKKLN